MCSFGVGTLQHSMLSTAVLFSPIGRPLLNMSEWLKWVLKLRRNITDHGPLLLLGVPLGTQVLASQRPSALKPGEPLKAINVIKDSGVNKLVGTLQWSIMLIWAFFYCTFSCDYWVASQVH